MPFQESAIRVLAIAVVKRGSDGALLVCRGDNRGRPFARPLGGAIEFGESAVEALRREVREELGTELDDIKLLGVIENRFKLRGSPGHEIVFVFSGRLTRTELYDLESMPVLDAPGRVASWWSPATDVELVPVQLLEMLADHPRSSERESRG